MTDTKKTDPPRGPASGEKHATKDDIARGYREGKFTIAAVTNPATGDVVKDAQEVPNYIAVDFQGLDTGHASLDRDRCLELRRQALRHRARHAKRST